MRIALSLLMASNLLNYLLKSKGTDFKSVPPAQKSLDGHRSYVYYVDLLYKLDKLHALFEEK